MSDFPLTFQTAGVEVGTPAGFLALQPAVRRHARFVFRSWPRDEREEAEAEAVAAAYQSYLALARRGKDPAGFPSRLAQFATLRVKNGRRVGVRGGHRDVLSRKAQRDHGFRVRPLPTEGAGWDEALVDDRTPVPEQVAFRLDFPAFLEKLPERDRRMALALGAGHSAKSVGRWFGVSPARVTQLRRRWQQEWLAFHQERPWRAGTPAAGALAV